MPQSTALARSLIVGACLLPAVGASQQGKETVYVAPSDATIQLEHENGTGRTQSRTVYLRNQSSVTVILTSIELKECRNIKQFCGREKRNIKIEPGQRRQILRLDPEVVTQSVNYRVFFQWKAENNTKTALGALADAGSAGAANRLAAINHQEEILRSDTLYKDKDLYAVDMRALGASIAALRADPDTVNLSVGAVMFVPQLRLLALDASGKVLGRVRGGLSWQIAGSPFVAFAPPDTLRAFEPGATTVRMRAVGLDSVVMAALKPVVFTIVVR